MIFHLSRPKLDLDAQIPPLISFDILDPEDFRRGQNDGPVLVIHALGNGLNRWEISFSSISCGNWMST
jgi:hypothetical protein